MQVNEVKVVRAEELVAAPRNLRVSSTEDTHIHEFAAKLESVGQLSPVVVYYDKKNDVLVKGDGDRRTKACFYLEEQGSNIKDLNPGEIRVIIARIVEDIEAEASSILLDQISANEAAHTTSGRDYGKAIHTLVTECDMTIDGVGQELGLSRSSIYKWVKALNLGEAILDKIKAGDISLNVAEKAAKKFRKLNEEQQAEVLDKAESLPLGEFTEWHEDFLENAATPKKTAEFTVKYRPLKKDELIAELENAEAEFASDSTPLNEGRLLGLQIALQVTEEEVAEQRADWETKQAKKNSKSPESLRSKAQKLLEEAEAAEASEAKSE